MRGFLRALAFLTVLPAPARPAAAGDWGRAALWFPAVGLLLGVLVAGAWQFGLRFWSAPLAAALTVAVWAGLTGGLHLDGLADCGDGLGAAASRERRLEIMRDARLGAFGAASLFIFLSLKILAVAELSAGETPLWPGAWLSLPEGIYALPLAALTARWLALAAARLPAARAEGLGADFGRETGPAVLCGALLLTALFIAAGGPRAWLAAGAAHLTAALFCLCARARLGGLTGDVLGAVVELSELSVLLVYAAGRS